MRTIKIYECEVCGYVSNDSSEVEKCENQGNHHKFSVKNHIRHIFSVEEEGRVVQSMIVEISLEQRTHKVSYGVIIDPSDLTDYHFENDVFHVDEDKVIGLAK